MDPCPFVKLIIESLTLKLPPPTRPTGPYSVPNPTSYYCKLHIKHFPTQTALLTISTQPSSQSSAAVFQFDSAALRRVSRATLKVSVFSGQAGRSCGIRSGKLMGRVEVVVDLALNGSEMIPTVFQNGWVKLGQQTDTTSLGLAKLHLVVRSEPDPRFVFQFGGEPECSPVVFQIQGSIRQPVFSCKFSADRNSRSRSIPSDFTNNNNKGWIRSFSTDVEKSVRERKGWMIMIYDLSGSPVAAASMITPFVPSPGTDRVSRSNPGAWLILQPYGFSVSSWKPWGRLEAWREKCPVDSLGYKFELVTENNGPDTRIPIAEATLSVKHGGKFVIDPVLNSLSPVKGFVMGSTVAGAGKVSKPNVEVGVQHVTCMSDAAIFVALSAAIDLSMDACQLFSHKLKKELCLAEQDSVS